MPNQTSLNTPGYGAEELWQISIPWEFLSIYNVCMFSLSLQFAQSFNAILLEKQKQNTYSSQDGNKRKTQTVKDNFVPVSKFIV